jgi:hypothetical protein
MERGVAALSLATATVPIPDYGSGPDPYQMCQVHDYLSVSFLRMDPHVKAASSATIPLLQHHYPELLSRKFFVSVPLIMSWVFAAMKLIVKRETMAKFVVLSHKEQLAVEVGDGEDVPKEYGGKGPALDVQKEVEMPATTLKTKEEEAKVVAEA